MLDVISVSCPDGFQWSPTSSKCYSTELYGPVSGTDILETCRDVRLEAIPAEPRDSIQMADIGEIAGEKATLRLITRMAG